MIGAIAVAGPSLTSGGDSTGWLRYMLGVFREQPGVICHRGEFLEAMPGGSGRPREFFVHEGFDKRYKPRHIVEHRWPNVDELIDAVRPGEHPALAMRAKEVTVLPMQPADDRFAFHYQETTAREHGGQGICTGAHSLAAPAVTGHCQNRRFGCSNTQLSAAACAVPR